MPIFLLRSHPNTVTPASSIDRLGAMIFSTESGGQPSLSWLSRQWSCDIHRRMECPKQVASQNPTYPPFTHPASTSVVWHGAITGCCCVKASSSIQNLSRSPRKCECSSCLGILAGDPAGLDPTQVPHLPLYPCNAPASISRCRLRQTAELNQHCRHKRAVRPICS